MTSKGLKTVYECKYTTNKEWYVTNGPKLRRHQHGFSQNVTHTCTGSVVYHFCSKTACHKNFFQILSQKPLRLWIAKILIWSWCEESTLSVNFMDSWSVFGFWAPPPPKKKKKKKWQHRFLDLEIRIWIFPQKNTLLV